MTFLKKPEAYLPKKLHKTPHRGGNATNGTCICVYTYLRVLWRSWLKKEKVAQPINQSDFGNPLIPKIWVRFLQLFLVGKPNKRYGFFYKKFSPHQTPASSNVNNEGLFSIRIWLFFKTKFSPFWAKSGWSCRVVRTLRERNCGRTLWFSCTTEQHFASNFQFKNIWCSFHRSSTKSICFNWKNGGLRFFTAKKDRLLFVPRGWTGNWWRHAVPGQVAVRSS